MIKLIREQKTAILSGLAASILFAYFLQPILEVTSKVVVTVMTIASSAFLDKIYAQAASFTSQDYSFIWLLFVFGTFSAMFFYHGLYILAGEDRLKAMLLKFRSKPRSERPFITRLIFGSLYLSTLLLFLVVVSANFIQLRAMASFQQQMRALAPHLDAAEEERIYSKWSLMRTQAEYQSIEEILRSHAREQNVQLPESALYTPTTL